MPITTTNICYNIKKLWVYVKMILQFSYMIYTLYSSLAMCTILIWKFFVWFTNFRISSITKILVIFYIIMRTATVTISAPAASTAAAFCSKSLYLPVPTIRRDLNVRPATVHVSSAA